jgi:hypothetical protein
MPALICFATLINQCILCYSNDGDYDIDFYTAETAPSDSTGPSKPTAGEQLEVWISGSAFLVMHVSDPSFSSFWYVVFTSQTLFSLGVPN